MTKAAMTHVFRRERLTAFIAIAMLGALANPVSAQTEPAITRSPILTVGAADSGLSRKVELTKGRSIVVELPRDAKEVFVANPAVANAVVRSTRKVFVIGMEAGATSIFVMDADGRQITALDVVVARELKLGLLKQTLLQSVPDGRFDVNSVGDSIVLSGSVGSAADASRAFDLAKAFVGISSIPGGAAGSVINNLTIREKDQVMLRVTVVEVARNVIKQFGINTQGQWSAFNPLGNGNPPGTAPDFINNAPFPITGGSTPANNLLTGSIKGAGFSLQATLKAFEQAGVSRILAEPTLTAISGESAKFLAGGEFPVPGLSSYLNGIYSPSVTYKPYGVALTFTPVVLSENRISIRVGTDVTEIDQQNSLTYELGSGSTSVPGTKVRRSETTIELPSGGVMMTAGLIQQVNKQAITGLPGLINLPILGALFRSRDYQRQETELMILCTPFIVKPMQASQVSRPDDGFVDATDAQAILLGKLTRTYGSAGGRPLGKNYRGNVGFIAD